MTTIYYTATSLDGFIADPAHSLAWLFAQQHVEPQEPALRMDTLTDRMGALLLGRSTFDWILREQAAGAGSAAWPYTLPTWVMTSRDLPAVPDADVRRAAGDVAEAFPAIRESAGDRDVWVVGGGDLAGQLADAGLLDEVVLCYAPVTLGAGAPVLPRRLQLAPVGHERAGDFLYGHFTVTGPRPAPDWTP